MSDETDDLAGIFDGLTPADFDRPTSAFLERAQSRAQGAASFDAFVNEQVVFTRIGFTASDGDYVPLAALSGPRLAREFVPEDDETMPQFVNRLAREAGAMEATWFFISRRTVVAVSDEEGSGPDIDGRDSLRDAIGKGVVREGVVWYAERREGAERECRRGILDIVGYRLGSNTEAGSDREEGVFALILDSSRD